MLQVIIWFVLIYFFIRHAKRTQNAQRRNGNRNPYLNQGRSPVPNQQSVPNQPPVSNQRPIPTARPMASTVTPEQPRGTTTARKSQPSAVPNQRRTPHKKHRKSAQADTFGAPQSGNSSKSPSYSFETASSQRSYVEPTKPYRPLRNAGLRYESWDPIPEGRKVCRCGYCGADNLIPRGANPCDYSCYFCREEL